MDLLKNKNFIITLITSSIVGIIIIFTLIIINNFTIETKWGSLAKSNCDKFISKYKTKINTQYTYSIHMKNFISNDLPQQYEKTLRKYIKQNNLNINEKTIQSDVKYYTLLTIAMNDVCEDETINTMIIKNDLYRYEGDKWIEFKKYIFDIFFSKGTEILNTYYDDNKVVMPIAFWISDAKDDIALIINKRSDTLLNHLRTESILYHKVLNN